MSANDLLCVFGVNGAGKTRLLRSIEQRLPEGDIMRVGTETLVDAGKLTAVASDLPLTKWIEINPGIARLLMEGTNIQLT